MIDSTYEDKLYQTPKFAGAVRYNVLKSCATRVCRACLDEITCVAVMYLALRTGCSRGKILCRSPISQRSHVGNLRQTLQGKGVIHKRVETAGVYPLVRPRGVSALPAEVQRKTPRPLGANTPAAVRVPRSAGAEKEPPG